MSIPSDSELLRRAYEEVQRLHAELADRDDAALEDGRSTYWRLRAVEAEAAIARARELLEGIMDRMGSYDHYVPPTAEDIFALRVALDGAE